MAGLFLWVKALLFTVKQCEQGETVNGDCILVKSVFPGCYGGFLVESPLQK
jgi:hypothetical protein